jgi:hypothetical protein
MFAASRSDLCYLTKTEYNPFVLVKDFVSDAVPEGFCVGASSQTKASNHTINPCGIATRTKEKPKKHR